MNTLIKNLNARTLAHEFPAFVISLLTTEFAFKFHSFILECLSFLILWGITSNLLSRFPKR
jgi:hypothetical protein